MHDMLRAAHGEVGLRRTHGPYVRGMSLRARLLLGGTLIAVISALASALGSQALSQLQTASRMSEHARDVIASADSLYSGTLTTQSAGRAYISTGDLQHRAAVEAARIELGRLGRQLQAQVADNPAQSARVRRLRHMTDAYAQLTEQRLDRYRDQVPLPAGQLRGLFAKGSTRLTAIRAQYDEILSIEQTLAGDRRQRAETFGVTTRTTIIIAAGLTALLLAAYVLYLLRALGDPVTRAAAVARRIGAGQLDGRLPVTGLPEIRQLGQQFNAMVVAVQDRQGSLETAVRQAEREASRRRAITNSSYDGFMAVGADGFVSDSNPQAAALFGYEPDGLTGRCAARMFADKGTYHRMTQDLIGPHAAPGETRRVELTAIRADRTRFPVELSVSAADTGDEPVLCIFARDIAERQAQELRSADKLAVTEALARPDTTVETLQACAQALSRLPRRSIGFWQMTPAGVKLTAAHGDTLAPADTDMIRCLLEADISSCGRQRYIPVLAAGQVLAVMQVSGVAGEFEWLGERAAQIGASLGARFAAERAEREREEFFAVVSHELRTPLTSIIGYLQTIDEEGEDMDPATRDSFMGVVGRNARRLHRLVGDILFVTQQSSGEMVMLKAPADPGCLLAEAVAAAQPAADAAGITLNLQAPGTLPVLDIDGDRIGQVLDNLLSNALKFSPAASTVTVSACHDGPTVSVSVSDEGMGINAEDQQRVFDRFFRSAQATDRAVAGVGLGLNICRQIAEAHGGTLTVSSVPGQGATFTLTLASV